MNGLDIFLNKNGVDEHQIHTQIFYLRITINTAMLIVTQL